MPRPQDIAAEAPQARNTGIHTNPYFGHELKSGIGPEPSPYDERLKGLDGDLLDAMIRGRAQEALHIGHADGFKEASARYAQIFDEGYGTGHRDGAIKQHGELAQACAEPVVEVQMALAELASKTGSVRLRTLAEEGSAALAAVIGAFNSPPVGQ